MVASLQVWVQGEVAAGGEPVLAVRVGVESGEHGAPRGAAGGLCDVGDVELDSARGEGVDPGSFDDGVAVATELEAEVVGGDEQDVGFNASSDQADTAAPHTLIQINKILISLTSYSRRYGTVTIRW